MIDSSGLQWVLGKKKMAASWLHNGHMIDSVGKSFASLRCSRETEEKEMVCLSSLVLHSLTQISLCELSDIDFGIVEDPANFTVWHVKKWGRRKKWQVDRKHAETTRQSPIHNYGRFLTMYCSIEFFVYTACAISHFATVHQFARRSVSIHRPVSTIFIEI